MISDYSELVAEVTERTGAPGVANRAGMFVGLAETVLNRRLAVSGMEATTTMTTDTNGKAALPAEHVRTRLVEMGGKAVAGYDIRAIQNKERSGYTIQGSTMVTSFPGADLVVHYYGKIPSLEVNATNWLLAAHPDVYLYAVMQQVFLASLDAEKAATVGAYLESLIVDVEMADAMARFGNTRRRIG